jgi:hypothetical protein
MLITVFFTCNFFCFQINQNQIFEVYEFFSLNFCKYSITVNKKGKVIKRWKILHFIYSPER